MLCSYLGTLVLRKVSDKSTGDGLGNQPFSALMEEMEEKLKNRVIKTGLITMKGDLKVLNDNSDDADLTEPIEEFILGHPEYFITMVLGADPVQSQFQISTQHAAAV